MNDANTNTNTIAPSELEKMIDSVKKVYFSADKLKNAQKEIERVLKICEVANLSADTTWDQEKGIPENYGIAIVPIRGRTGNGDTKTTGVRFAAIPEIGLIEKAENGKSFIHDTIVDKLIAKVANATRSESVVPFSVESFISSNRPEGLLKTFNELCKIFRKPLAEKMGAKGKLFTNQVFRSCLENAKFAESEFKNWPQSVWEAILDKMIAKANEMGLNDEILVQWKNSRNDLAEIEVEEIGIEDLNF